MSILRRYPVLITMVLVALCGVAGTIIYGRGFLARPIPVPESLAAIWMSFNLFVASIALFLLYRRTLRYFSLLTWQELGLTRGVLLLLFAGVLGNLGRAFSQPTVTLGTPLFTAGCLLVIWATVRPSERLQGSTDGSPR